MSSLALGGTRLPMKVRSISEPRGGSTYGRGLEGRSSADGNKFSLKAPWRLARGVSSHYVIYRPARSSSPSRSGLSEALLSYPVRGEATDSSTMDSITRAGPNASELFYREVGRSICTQLPRDGMQFRCWGISGRVDRWATRSENGNGQIDDYSDTFNGILRNRLSRPDLTFCRYV